MAEDSNSRPSKINEQTCEEVFVLLFAAIDQVSMPNYPYAGDLWYLMCILTFSDRGQRIWIPASGFDLRESDLRLVLNNFRSWLSGCCCQPTGCVTLLLLYMCLEGLTTGTFLKSKNKSQ